MTERIVMEEHNHRAQTCDMWGHVIKEPLPTTAGSRSKAATERDREDGIYSHLPPQLSPTNRKHRQPLEEGQQRL